MSNIRIESDAHAPTVAIELPLVRPLEDYDIAEVERESTREVDGIFVSQGFRDLVDDAHAAPRALLEGAPLELVQLTGQICKAGPGFCPGLWLLLRERGTADGQPASSAACEHAARITTELRRRLHLD